MKLKGISDTLAKDIEAEEEETKEEEVHITPTKEKGQHQPIDTSNTFITPVDTI